MTREWVLAAVVPAVLAWVAIALLARMPWAAVLADHPNSRSLHERATPRLGGLGILLGVLPAALVLASGPLAAILACALVLALLSLADDAWGLPVSVRLTGHLVAAGIAWLVMAAPPPGSAGVGWLASVAAIVAIAWMANLFNFMDGSDGLAGGMAAIGFATLAAGAWDSGQRELALVCVAIASASVGFLAHNFPPARVFLGDVGSIPLGFLAGALGLYGTLSGAWPLAFPLLAFFPFIVDASLTLARRALRRERVWVAHREHVYQRLALAGWPRRRLALAAYAVMLAFAVAALVLRPASPMLQCGIILGSAAVFGILLAALDRHSPT